MENKKEKITKSEEAPLNLEEKSQTLLKSKKTLYQQLCYIKSNITVEPIFIGLMISSMLSRLAVQNLNLDKACRVKLNYGVDICDALIQRKDNLTNYEINVQKVISSIEAWKSIIQTSIPTILVIFMGAWSDKSGNRKICILVPVFGELMVTLCNIISTYFFYEIPIEVTMFLEAIFPAITGGWVMVYLGIFSYISDITTNETRTFRVGMANLCLTAGVPIGTALSGILLDISGYYGVFGISASMYIMTLIYGIFYLKSNTKSVSKETKNKSLKITDIGSLIKETAKVATKKREGNLQKKVILVLLLVAIVYGPNHGERIINYLYVRYKLRWNAVRYSMYSTFSVITHSIGALFSISVFSKRWHWQDCILCLISVLSKFCGSIFVAFVTTDLQMYMVPLVEILNATTFTSLRSMASKLVADEELGKMNSLFSLVETLAALVFDPLYSSLYSFTLNIFVGTVFIFSGIMTLPAMCLLLWFFVKHRQDKNKNKTQTSNDEQENVALNEAI